MGSSKLPTTQQMWPHSAEWRGADEASNLDGRAVDAVHLCIDKAFNNIYHHILTQADELPTKVVDSEVD